MLASGCKVVPSGKQRRRTFGTFIGAQSKQSPTVRCRGFPSSPQRPVGSRRRNICFLHLSLHAMSMPVPHTMPTKSCSLLIPSLPYPSAQFLLTWLFIIIILRAICLLVCKTLRLMVLADDKMQPQSCSSRRCLRWHYLLVIVSWSLGRDLAGAT